MRDRIEDRFFDVMAKLNHFNLVEAIEGPGRIVISTEKRPGTVTNEAPEFAVMSVSDSGKGLTEEEQEKIGRSGTGLGMSVVLGLFWIIKDRLISKVSPAEVLWFPSGSPLSRNVNKMLQTVSTLKISWAGGSWLLRWMTGSNPWKAVRLLPNSSRLGRQILLSWT